LPGADCVLDEDAQELIRAGKDLHGSHLAVKGARRRADGEWIASRDQHDIDALALVFWKQTVVVEQQVSPGIDGNGRLTISQ